jgi:hypothetical protein
LIAGEFLALETPMLLTVATRFFDIAVVTLIFTALP